MKIDETYIDFLANIDGYRDALFFNESQTTIEADEAYIQQAGCKRFDPDFYSICIDDSLLPDGFVTYQPSNPRGPEFNLSDIATSMGASPKEINLAGARKVLFDGNQEKGAWGPRKPKIQKPPRIPKAKRAPKVKVTKVVEFEWGWLKSL